MRLQLAMLAVGMMGQTVAGCSMGDFDVPPQRGIQADIDASRTQRGDALYPDSTVQQRQRGVDRH